MSGLAAITVSAVGAEIDASKLPPASTKTGLTYEHDIKPILQESCFRCHGEKQQKGKLRVDSLEALMKGGESGKIVVVGDGAKSSIVIAVSHLDPDLAMPPKQRARPPRPAAGGTNAPAANQPPPAKPLTPEQVGLVRAWIDQGAK